MLEWSETFTEYVVITFLSLYNCSNATGFSILLYVHRVKLRQLLKLRFFKFTMTGA